jgi:ABC-type Zn uptake system ZnuABC Zn-binding protein ZnuA
MKAENIKVILTESYYPRRGPDFLAGKTGATVVTAAVSAGGARDVKTYFDVFDRVIADLEKAAAPSPFDALKTAGGCSKAAEACGR